MTLRQVLEQIDDSKIELIEYRTIIPIDSDDVDIFTGECAYNDGLIVSLDGDIYSLEDEICKYEENGRILTVWYESELIGG